MRDQIAAALRGWDADYIDIRIEESESTRIVYRGRTLDDIGEAAALGGCARALKNGGWGFVSFNSLDGLRERVGEAVAHARLVGSDATHFAGSPVVVVDVPAALLKDPATIPLRAKKQLLDEYNDVIWATPDIQTSSIRYNETRKTVTFANSEGSYIVQRSHDCGANLGAVARQDGDVQQAHLSLGAAGDYSFIEGLHSRVREMANSAVRLLAASAPAGGPTTVILDPVLAGVFVHEAFGHLSESDHVAENPQMREIMTLGRRFGSAQLNILDGAAVPGLRASYAYDDEGVAATTTHLVREGELVGRLHSRETAARLGEQPTGNARAQSYRHQPLVRMTNTYIANGNVPFHAMLADVKDGIYAKSWYGGTTTMEQFTFSAAEAFRIRNGRVEEPLRGVVLSGNLFTTLQNVDAIGNDLQFSQGGACGKGGQWVPVSDGGPHLRIRECVVGGQ